ncbi:probable magnesium transporter NIPA3 isoform X1 [Vigna angularis]|uniref:probable magnesium transporter NIPA3 isoform X1 n=1 Tax=Phaseolus angularis TaxID=3914 RepID=UPI0022B32291|nr:probable magnesium transporter NIPA3 isoform X1 [Vigna angularis]
MMPNHPSLTSFYRTRSYSSPRSPSPPNATLSPPSTSHPRSFSRSTPTTSFSSLCAKTKFPSLTPRPNSCLANTFTMLVASRRDSTSTRRARCADFALRKRRHRRRKTKVTAWWRRFGGSLEVSKRLCYTENLKGLILALVSSGFITASFIIKKQGLRRAAAASGVRAGFGGYYYLLEPLWWVGMITTFLAYGGSVIVLVFILVFHFAPKCGHTNVLVYIGICSLMGSLSVMSVKALGTSLKLTFEGKNQLIYPETWFFMLVVAICVIMQMNYLHNVSFEDCQECK